MTIPMTYPFLFRASLSLLAGLPPKSAAKIKEDLQSISRVAGVVNAITKEAVGNRITYMAQMQEKTTMSELRTVTGQLQNLFGSRLLSSGVTSVMMDGRKIPAVKVTVSLLSVV